MSSAVLVDRGPAVFIVTLVVLLVATAFVVLRLISRWGIMRKQSGDDWLVVVSWIFAVGQCVSIMMTTRYGLGKPDANIPPEHSDELAASIYAFTIFYHPALMATKSAILVLYLRMSTGYPFLRIASYVTMAIVNVSGLVLTLLSVFRCRPISAAFSTTEGKCIQLIDLYLSTAPITILTDVAILVLPLPILTALRMESRQKIVLVATFFVGGFVTVVDVVRIVYLQRALEEERGVTINQDGTQANVTYHASFSLMWSAVEVCVGLVCACALVLRPLVMRVVPSMLTGKRRASQQNQRSDNSKEKSPKQPSGVNRKAPVSPMSQKVSVLPGPLPIPGQEQDEYSAAGDRPTGEEDGRDDGAMGFLEMLSGDAETSAPHVQPVLAPQSTLNASEKVTRASGGFSLRPFPTIHRPSAPSIDALQHPTGNFFDFVNMGSRKSLTKLTSREAWWPVISVSVLFFIWGFAYGLLGTLNGEIQALLRYGPDRTIALHSSYWIAYAVSPPLIGYWTLTRTSFKFTFITGLCLYSVGAMSFWPSAVLLSYGGFFVSNFIIAAGLACLEVAANPFIALAGPEHLSEARLNFAQGIQAVGSIFSPMLAKKVMFRRVNAVSLFNVQWWYLAVALFVIALAVVFYYVPLADATDDDLEDAANETLAWANLDRSARLPMPFGKRAPPGYILLLLGAIIMFFYVGAQETISYFWGPIFYAIHQDTDEDPFWNQAIAHAVFAVGRFLASFACYIGVPPRLVLLFCIFGAFLTSLLTLVLPVPSEGAHGTLILISFFESAIFPTLFALVTRNQGKDLKLVSTIMIGAVSGGAVMPAIGHGVALHNDNLAEGRRPLIIVVVLYGLSLLFPIWLCGGMRKWVDPIRPSRRGSGDAVELQMAPSARSDATSIAKIIEPLDQK